MIRQLIKEIYDDIARRQSIHRLLVKHRNQGLDIGNRCFLKRCHFGKDNRIYENCRLVDVTLGDRTYISEDCRMYNVHFGSYCAVGPAVMIGLGMHPSTIFVSIHPLFYSRNNSASFQPFSDGEYFTEHLPIFVGHDVWIGARTIIHDGVSIGNGAIIGSGSIVARDVPPYAVVAGSPARILRFRFEKDEIAFLEEFAWWDRDVNWLKTHWKDFHTIQGFLNTYLKGEKPD